MWVSFLVGFVAGFITMFLGWALMSMGKKNEYEEKLWELEKLRMKYESRERENN